MQNNKGKEVMAHTDTCLVKYANTKIELASGITKATFTLSLPPTGPCSTLADVCLGDSCQVALSDKQYDYCPMFDISTDV